MDIRLWDNVLLLPDMMQFVNPVNLRIYLFIFKIYLFFKLLTLTFIFVFEGLVYPLVSCFVKLTPLRKMVSGGVLAAVAFFVSAGVQLKVNVLISIFGFINYNFVLNICHYQLPVKD